MLGGKATQDCTTAKLTAAALKKHNNNFDEIDSVDMKEEIFSLSWVTMLETEAKVASAKHYSRKNGNFLAEH